MKSSKYVVLIALAAVMVLATAASAYADNSQGTVYGQATMRPTVSIQVNSAPLWYSGKSGQTVPSNWWMDPGMGEVEVYNDGDAATSLSLGWGTDPTSGQGNDNWTFGDSADTNVCVWQIGGVNVPSASSGSPRALYSNLNVGQNENFDTNFTFPTNYTNGNRHDMTAIISAENIY